jgi:hypothetical protein
VNPSHAARLASLEAQLCVGRARATTEVERQRVVVDASVAALSDPAQVELMMADAEAWTAARRRLSPVGRE